jgi:hypothetical protein
MPCSGVESVSLRRESRIQLAPRTAENSAMPVWERYRERYKGRPETFEAYVDVWNRMPAARASFGGWVAFSQAANAEPAWKKDRAERVRTAEHIMRSAGYDIGPATERGARQWVLAHRPKRFGTLRLFGLKISL